MKQTSWHYAKALATLSLLIFTSYLLVLAGVNAVSIGAGEDRTYSPLLLVLISVYLVSWVSAKLTDFSEQSPDSNQTSEDGETKPSPKTLRSELIYSFINASAAVAIVLKKFLHAFIYGEIDQNDGLFLAVSSYTDDVLSFYKSALLGLLLGSAAVLIIAALKIRLDNAKNQITGPASIFLLSVTLVLDHQWREIPLASQELAFGISFLSSMFTLVILLFFASILIYYGFRAIGSVILSGNRKTSFETAPKTKSKVFAFPALLVTTILVWWALPWVVDEITNFATDMIATFGNVPVSNFDGTRFKSELQSRLPSAIHASLQIATVFAILFITLTILPRIWRIANDFRHACARGFRDVRHGLARAITAVFSLTTSTAKHASSAARWIGYFLAAVATRVIRQLTATRVKYASIYLFLLIALQADRLIQTPVIYPPAPTFSETPAPETPVQTVENEIDETPIASAPIFSLQQLNICARGEPNFQWVTSSTETMQAQLDDCIPDLDSRNQNSSYIAIGLASPGQNRDIETQRALERAETLAAWLRSQGVPNNRIFALNLGMYANQNALWSLDNWNIETYSERPILILKISASSNFDFIDANAVKATLENLVSESDLAQFSTCDVYQNDPFGHLRERTRLNC